MQYCFVFPYSKYFPKEEKMQVEALGTECKLPWRQQQLGKVLVLIISFSQKEGEDFCWPTPVASKTCNRRAVYLPQRGVDIKEEGPINVVASHLPKMGFIPTGKNKETHNLL